MKYSTKELAGELLDRAVWLANGRAPSTEGGTPPFSRLWVLAGPIIERERIGVTYPELEPANGYEWHGMCDVGCYGPTPLIAAMRAFVLAKLGPEVELP